MQSHIHNANALMPYLSQSVWMFRGILPNFTTELAYHNPVQICKQQANLQNFGFKLYFDYDKESLEIRATVKLMRFKCRDLS